MFMFTIANQQYFISVKFLHMKKFLPWIFCLPLFSYSADWDLYRLNQTSFYTYHYYQRTNVGVQIMDSVQQNGAEKIFYFNRNIPYENGGQCYHATYNTFAYQAGDLFTNDSLVQRNDSVFYNSLYSTLP